MLIFMISLVVFYLLNRYFYGRKRFTTFHNYRIVQYGSTFYIERQNKIFKKIYNKCYYYNYEEMDEIEGGPMEYDLYFNSFSKASDKLVELYNYHKQLSEKEMIVHAYSHIKNTDGE